MIRVCAVVLLCGGAAGAGEEPDLPLGLDDDKSAVSEEPELPMGLDTPVEDGAAGSDDAGLELPFDLSGFWEVRVGSRLQEDPYQKESSIFETRLQAEVEKAFTSAVARITADFVYDDVIDRDTGHEIRLEEGRGWIDLREASVGARPASFMDVKVGRQVLTWGTGDMIFINDLFPKDWKSFFVGRDSEYLKAPSDALKVSLFSDRVNVDLVYTPRFDRDRFIDGERISYWNDALGRRAGRDAMVDTDRPDWLDDDELAARAFRTVGAYEVCFYGYRGFWKSPAGMDAATGKATFPALTVYGGSVLGPVASGIGRAEVGWFDSGDDRSGDDPLVRNGEFRLLLGYERQAGRELTLGLQYYLEHMLEYENYEDVLPAGGEGAREDRHVVTIRLTKLLMRQSLRLSLFGFYSPSDRDAYVRPRVHLTATDSWSVFGGADMFLGEDDYTFFGQFEKNSNAHMGVRYSF